MFLWTIHPAQMDEPFTMTVLAIKMSRTANGVSEFTRTREQRNVEGFISGQAGGRCPHRVHYQRCAYTRMGNRSCTRFLEQTTWF